MLIQDEAVEYIARIHSIAARIGIAPFILNRKTKQFELTKSRAYPYLWFGNLCLGILSLLVFGIALIASLSLQASHKLPPYFLIFWVIVLLIMPGRIWVGLTFMLNSEEWLHNLNYGIQLIQLIEHLYEKNWKKKETKRDLRVSQILKNTCKTVCYTTLYIESVAVCLILPTIYWEETLIMTTPVQDFMRVRAGLEFSPYTIYVPTVLFFMITMYSTIMQYNILLTAFMTNLSLGYWVLDLKLLRLTKDAKKMEKRKPNKKLLSSLENSVRVYNLMHILVTAFCRLVSTFCAALIGVGILVCSFLLFFISSNMMPLKERGLAGLIFIGFLSLAVFLLNLAGKLNVLSVKLLKSWKSKTAAQFLEGKTNFKKYTETELMIKAVRPMWIIAGGSYYVRRISDLQFVDNTVDRTIFLWQIFRRF